MSENDKSTIVVTDDYIKEGTIESVIAIYRNLRENCEYWLRYDEASQFFMREMELKRIVTMKGKRMDEKVWR